MFHVEHGAPARRHSSGTRCFDGEPAWRVLVRPGPLECSTWNTPIRCWAHPGKGPPRSCTPTAFIAQRTRIPRLGPGAPINGRGRSPWSDRSPGPGQAFTSHDRHGAPAPWASLPGGKAVRFVGQRRWPIDVPRGTTATLTPPSTKPQAPPQPQVPRCDGQDHLGTAAWASPQVAQPSRAAPTPSLPDHRPAKPDSSPRAAGTTSDTTSEHGPKLWSGCSTWNNSPTTMSFPIVDNPPSHSPGPLPPSQAWSPHHALEARERLSRQSRAAATTSRSPWRTGGELPADRQDPTQAGSAPPPTQRPTPPRRWRTPKDHKALWPWQIQIESLGAI